MPSRTKRTVWQCGIDELERSESLTAENLGSGVPTLQCPQVDSSQLEPVH